MDNYRTYICERCFKFIKGARVTLHEIDGSRTEFHPKCMEKEEQRDRKKLRKRGKVSVLPNQGG